MRYKQLFVFTLFLSLIIGLGEFFPYQMTRLFPNRVFVDNSSSVVETPLNKDGIETYYFSSGVNAIRDTGSRQVSDIEFVLRHARAEEYNEITIVSDFNETTGSAAAFAEHHPGVILNTVMVERLVRPAIAALVTPRSFSPWGTTQVWVALQGLEFECDLRLKVGDEILATERVGPDTPVEFPLQFAIHKFKDVQIELELIFKGSVLSSQSAILQSLFQQHIAVEGVTTGFAEERFLQAGLKPIYGTADFSKLPSAVFLFNPPSSQWSAARVAELKSFIASGGKAALFVTAEYLIKARHSLKDIFAVAAKQKIALKELDVLIDSSAAGFAIAMENFPQLEGVNITRYFWNGEAFFENPIAELPLGSKTSTLMGLTKLLNSYRQQGKRPDELFVFTAQDQDRSIVPAPLADLPVTIVASSPASSYIEELRSVVGAAVVKAPQDLNATHAFLRKKFPLSELRPIEVADGNLRGSVIDIAVAAGAKIVAKESGGNYPLVVKNEIGAGAAFAINLQSGEKQEIALALAALGGSGSEQIAASALQVKLRARTLELTGSAPFTVRVNTKVSSAVAQGEGYALSLPMALRGAHTIEVLRNKVWVPLYVIFTQVDAESTFSAANTALAEELSAISGGTHYASVDQWRQHRYIAADTRRLLRKIALIFAFFSLCGLALLRLHS